MDYEKNLGPYTMGEPISQFILEILCPMLLVAGLKSDMSVLVFCSAFNQLQFDPFVPETVFPTVLTRIKKKKRLPSLAEMQVSLNGN